MKATVVALAVVILLGFGSFLGSSELSVAVAQPASQSSTVGFDAQHEAQVLASPSGVVLTISTPKDSYHVGETIPVTLRFRNTTTHPYQVWAGSYDRSGRIMDISFAIDGPAGGWADPLSLYFRAKLNGVMMGGGLGQFVKLGEHAQTFDMNEWVRFDKPGTYRIYCASSRVELAEKNQPHPPITSQVLGLKVVAADETFTRTVLTEAKQAMETDDVKTRNQAVRSLRFLATPQAVEMLARLVDQPAFGMEAMFGLVGARDSEAALTTLQRLMNDSDVAVGAGYIHAMVLLSLSPSDLTVPSPQSVWQQQQGALDRKIKALTDEFTAKAAAAVGSKRGRAMASSCAYLLFVAKKDSPELRRSLAATFELLSQDERIRLLADYWALAKCPEFEPVLAKLPALPLKQENWTDPGEASLSLLRYGDFQPRKARELILADISQPSPKLSAKVALSLPVDSIPSDYDAVLRRNLTEAKHDMPRIAALVERYGTTAILSDVIAVYEKAEGRWACDIQECFLRYWIKQDRKAGLAALARAAGSRETGCYRDVFSRVLREDWGADAQDAILPFLGDASVDMIVQVAALLKENGNQQCVEPMIAALGKLELTARRPGDYSAPANGRAALVGALTEGKHFKLTAEQRSRIQALLKNDDRTRPLLIKD